MENNYIKSGLLFDKKKIGLILIRMAYNMPKTFKRANKEELMFDLIEEIDGNIWQAYLSKYGMAESIGALQDYIISHREAITCQINETGYPEITKIATREFIDNF